MQSFEMDNAQRQDNKENLNRHTPQNPQTEPNLEQRKRKGPRRIVYRFFHYTTINGLQRLASAKTIIGRLFWIAVLLAAFGLFSRDIYELVNQYYERPVTVVSKINYFRSLNFPAVTVCNVNPIKAENLDKLGNGLKERITDRNANACFREDLRERNEDCNEENDELNDFDDQVNFILANTNEKTLRANGHKLRDFVAACRYGGIRCRKKMYWTQFWDPKYGNCFIFNSQLTGHNSSVPLFTATKPGSANGLHLELNIELEEYIPEITREAGVKVTVTQPDEMPFPLYQSLSLAPGFQTDIALKRVQIERADRFNNGSCRLNKMLGADNHYRLKYNSSYNIQACLHFCYSRSQITACGCAEYSYLTSGPNSTICDESDKETENCLKEWSVNSGSCDQVCRDPCGEIIYEPSVSFTEWPSAVSVGSVLESLGRDFIDYNESIADVRKNFLAVNIFFQRFRENKVEESLSYEAANLLADIGGQVGLWAGLSVISMCELLELLALLVRHFLRGER